MGCVEVGDGTNDTGRILTNLGLSQLRGRRLNHFFLSKLFTTAPVDRSTFVYMAIAKTIKVHNTARRLALVLRCCSQKRISSKLWGSAAIRVAE
jgi:hypothetical protein